MIRLAAPILTLGLFLVPHVAWACAVCFDSEDDNRQAFIDTTVLLTVLPLSVLGLFAWLVVRRIRQVEAKRQEAFRRDALKSTT